MQKNQPSNQISYNKQENQENQQAQNSSSSYTTKQINNFLLKFYYLVDNNELDAYLSNMSNFLKNNKEKDIEKLTPENKDFVKTFQFLMAKSKFGNYFSNKKENNAYSNIINEYCNNLTNYQQFANNDYYNQKEPAKFNENLYSKEIGKIKNAILELYNPDNPQYFLQQNSHIGENLINIFKTINLLKNAEELGLGNQEIVKQFNKDLESYKDKEQYDNNNPWYENNEQQIEVVENNNQNEPSNALNNKKYDKVNLAEYLQNVENGELIPAFDIDNTLCLANKGIIAFINIFKRTINENDIENATSSLECYLGQKGNYKQYFTLNLEQIALNYPEYESVIEKLISSLSNTQEKASCKDVITTLRKKVESLRKEGKEVPDDLFIAPLANKFINEIKNSKIEDKNVIIASVALSLDSQDIENNNHILSFLHQKFFGAKQNGNLYIPFQDDRRDNVWLQVYRDENKGLNWKTLNDTKVALEQNDTMNKAESLANLNNRLKKNILHLDNETRYDKNARNIQFVPFCHLEEEKLKIENYKQGCGYTTNQQMPGEEYAKNILDQLKMINNNQHLESDLTKAIYKNKNKEHIHNTTNDLLVSFNPKVIDKFCINNNDSFEFPDWNGIVHSEEETDIECDLGDKIQKINDTNQLKQISQGVPITKTQEKAESVKEEVPNNYITKPQSTSLLDKIKNLFSCCSGGSTVIR